MTLTSWTSNPGTWYWIA